VIMRWRRRLEWHRQWSPTVPPPPRSIVACDLDVERASGDFLYLLEQRWVQLRRVVSRDCDLDWRFRSDLAARGGHELQQPEADS